MNWGLLLLLLRLDRACTQENHQNPTQNSNNTTIEQTTRKKMNKQHKQTTTNLFYTFSLVFLICFCANKPRNRTRPVFVVLCFYCVSLLCVSCHMSVCMHRPFSNTRQVFRRKAEQMADCANSNDVCVLLQEIELTRWLTETQHTDEWTTMQTNSTNTTQHTFFSSRSICSFAIFSMRGACFRIKLHTQTCFTKQQTANEHEGTWTNMNEHTEHLAEKKARYILRSSVCKGGSENASQAYTRHQTTITTQHNTPWAIRTHSVCKNMNQTKRMKTKTMQTKTECVCVHTA